MISSRLLGERLTESRKRAGLTQAETAARLRISRPTLVAIEKGERRPSSQELVTLSQLFGVPLHDFLDEFRPHAAVSPRFRLPRSVDRESVPIQAAVERLRQMASHYVELERLAEVERIPARLELIRTYHLDQPSVKLNTRLAARDAANTVRSLLGLGDAPALALDERLEAEAGLRIFYLDHLPGGLAAIFIWGDDIGACVAINRAHPPERQRWSLTHEFGHFLHDREAGDILDDDHPARGEAETFADTFTAAFLLPDSGVSRHFADRLRANDARFNSFDLLGLARYYQVSFQATCHRLEELDLLPGGTYNRIVESKIRPGNLQAPGSVPAPAYPLGLPRRFLALAIAALDREQISESDFASFLGSNRVEARRVYQEQKGLSLEDGTFIDSVLDTEDLRAS